MGNQSYIPVIPGHCTCTSPLLHGLRQPWTRAIWSSHPGTKKMDHTSLSKILTISKNSQTNMLLLIVGQLRYPEVLHAQSDLVTEKCAHHIARVFLAWCRLGVPVTRNEIVNTVHEKQKNGVTISERLQVNVFEAGLSDDIWRCLAVLRNTRNVRSRGCGWQV